MIIYSTAGGLLAVIHTDVYQFIILISGFTITLVLLIPDLLNNMNQVRSIVPQEFFQLDGGKGFLFLITTFLAFLLGETFAPGYATRYCVGKNVKETKKGIVGAGAFLAFTFPGILFFIALYARIHFPNIDGEASLPLTVLKLNNPVIGGVIVAALMCAVMSSADSILNSSTAIFVKDLYEEYLSEGNPNRRKSLAIARFSSLGLGILGIFLALVLPNVIDLLLLTYNLWAPGIILPVIVGVFSNKKGSNFNLMIYITMVVATGATILYMALPFEKTIQPSIVGICVSCLVYFSFLLVFKGKQ